MQNRIDSPADGLSGELRNPFAFLLNSYRFPTEGVLPMLPQFAEAARRLEPVARAATRAQLETLSLLAQQARTAYELPTRLSACRTPQDVAATQVQFWRAVAMQQAEGVQRIAAVWSGLLPGPDIAAAKAPAPAPKRDILTFPETASAPTVAAATDQPKAPRFAAE
jgi:hypothetical protein